MHLSKGILLACFSFLLFFQVPQASAAIPEAELNNYLTEIGMTKEELQEYLDFYEIPIEEFESVEELRWIVGTPINDENFQELLNTYELTEQELHDLLEHFGDSLEYYMFIEELDAAVDFYVNHDQYMADIESDLAEIGITDEETERFFQYLAEVEERNQHQLDQMELIDARMEPFLTITDTTELTDEQLNELAQILTESIELYEVNVQFKLDGKEITLKDILKMEEAPIGLYMNITTKTGEPLIDFTLPAWLFETGEIIDEGEDLIHVGELSDEFVDHLHDEKYEDIDNILK